MQILKAENHRRMPWKNGGGETTEIAVFPPDAGLDGFDWRVSMAKVAESGPFSTFEGIDRTLAVLDGAGLILSVAGRAPIRLTAESEPLAFPADAPTEAALIDGAISDLNVMTRRGRLAHRVLRKELAGSVDIAAAAGTVLLVVHSGRLQVTADGGSAEMGPLDAAMMHGAAVRVEGQARFYLIEIERIADR